MEITAETYEERIGGIRSPQQYIVSFKEGSRTTAFRITPEELYVLRDQIKYLVENEHQTQLHPIMSQTNPQ